MSLGQLGLPDEKEDKGGPCEKERNKELGGLEPVRSAKSHAKDEEDDGEKHGNTANDVEALKLFSTGGDLVRTLTLSLGDEEDRGERARKGQ